MKKNYIAYLLLGGAVYYYIVNQKRKDKLKELQLKTLSPIPQKKNIDIVVKKILPAIKKLPIPQQSTNKQFDRNKQFDPFIFKDDLKNYKFVKPKPYDFPYLRPSSGIGQFPDVC